MKIKISDLVNDTIFYYDGFQYKLDLGKGWSAPSCGIYIGNKVNSNDLPVRECIPFLGEQYQTSMKKWITITTEVEITNNAILNKANSIIKDRKLDLEFLKICAEAGICHICSAKLKNGVCEYSNDIEHSNQ